MNEIERMFYDAFIAYDKEIDEIHDITPEYPIGIYRVDFMVQDCIYGVVIEIDGHEYHKTKEQRLNDYQRERFLCKQGFFTIRFMATEVFLDARECAKQAIECINHIGEIFSSAWSDGYDCCSFQAKR